MRFMIIIRSPEAGEADAGAGVHEAIHGAMAHYHDELARAGVLLDAAGLRPAASGWRIRYGADDRRTVTAGPFAQAEELLTGYTLIEVRSREEALEWARRCPNPAGAGLAAEIEVRQLYEAGDLPAGAGRTSARTGGTPPRA